MKRFGGLWEQVASFRNLREAAREARRGKRFRDYDRSVAVDGETAQAVALGVADAVGVRDVGDAEPLAKLQGGTEAGADEVLLRIDPREDADGDLRAGVVEAASDEGAVGVEDVGEGARVDVFVGLADHLAEEGEAAAGVADAKLDAGERHDMRVA